MNVAAPEAALPAPAATPKTGWQRAIVFGTGFGIAVGERNLDATIVRARPAGPALVAQTTIADFHNRSAAEWGAELARFLAAAGENGLPATVLLPRDAVTVRVVNLPGVADKDMAAAIELQIDSLHPWGDVEVAWGWSRAGRQAAGAFLVGLVRKDLLDSYETLFAEAGIQMAAVTFSTAAIHEALRVWSAPPAFFLCFCADERGRTETYGESDSRTVFSAEFAVARERAFSISRAALRIPPDAEARPLAEVLPQPFKGDSPGSPLAYAAAIAGAARGARFANLLPAARRASRNRLQYLIPGMLAVVLALALAAAFLIFPALEQRRYRADLDRAARQLEPSVLRAQALEKRIGAARAKIAMLDDFRGRPQSDLDILNELTRLLPPPIWTSAIEIYPDSVIVSGEADQAAPLLKTLDSSPLFQNSEFALSVIRSGTNEQFRIKTMRRGRAGRTTP